MFCYVISSVTVFSSPGLTWCRVRALQDHDTVIINVIHAVVAETEKFSDVAGMERGGGAEVTVSGDESVRDQLLLTVTEIFQ